MTRKPPAFQFYARDWLSDEAVRLMSLAERGAYITLLAHCWLEGSIPGDLPGLARICDTTPAEMEAIWGRIRSRFASKGNGRLINRRLFFERKMQRERSKKLTEFGKKGARNRWAVNDIDGQSHNTVTCPGYSTASASASAIASAIAPAIRKSCTEEPPKDDLYEWFCETFIGEKPADLWQRFPAYVSGKADLLRANLEDWMRTRKWKDGFGTTADRFLQSGYWHQKPHPSAYGPGPKSAMEGVE